MKRRSDDTSGLDGIPLPEGSPEPVSQLTDRGSARTVAAVLITLTVVVLLVAVFVARIYEIPSGSMETTLHGCAGCDDDRVLVDKLAYRFGQPRPDDIVVFTQPDSWRNSELPPPGVPTGPLLRGLQELGHELGLATDQPDLVKRVVAVGGQIVSCCDARNRLQVDGRGVDEPYLYFDPAFGPAQQQPFAPVRVPAGQLWVMGDSRNNSVDSRAEGNGPVPVTDVIGKVRMIVLPLSRWGLVDSGE